MRALQAPQIYENTLPVPLSSHEKARSLTWHLQLVSSCWSLYVILGTLFPKTSSQRRDEAPAAWSVMREIIAYLSITLLCTHCKALLSVILSVQSNSHLLWFYFTLRDWFKKLAPPSYPIRYKNCDSSHTSRASRQSQVFVSSSDWFTVLSGLTILSWKLLFNTNKNLVYPFSLFPELKVKTKICYPVKVS